MRSVAELHPSRGPHFSPIFSSPLPSLECHTPSTSFLKKKVIGAMCVPTLSMFGVLGFCYYDRNNDQRQFGEERLYLP